MGLVVVGVVVKLFGLEGKGRDGKRRMMVVSVGWLAGLLLVTIIFAMQRFSSLGSRCKAPEVQLFTLAPTERKIPPLVPYLE